MIVLAVIFGLALVGTAIAAAICASTTRRPNPFRLGGALLMWSYSYGTNSPADIEFRIYSTTNLACPFALYATTQALCLPIQLTNQARFFIATASNRITQVESAPNQK